MTLEDRLTEIEKNQKVLLEKIEKIAHIFSVDNKVDNHELKNRARGKVEKWKQKNGGF